MVKSRGQSTHQLPRNAGSMSGLSNLPARPEGKSHLGPLGQHDCGVLHESPRGAIIETPFHVSRAPPGMDSAQPALVESSTRSGQTEPRSRHVVTKQGPLRGVEASFSDGSENLVNLWLGGSRPLPFKRQFSLPNLLFQGQVCIQRQSPSLCYSPGYSDTAGNQANQETGTQSSPGGPALEKKQHWLAELSQLLIAAPWPIPLRRDLLSQENRTIWHPRPELWALHLWPLDGSLHASQSVF